MVYPVVSTEKYSRLEKNVWTEKDYFQMGWHDCTIYAMAFKDSYNDYEFKNELILDIDYIFEWVKPVDNDRDRITFWVAPCTLIFKNVSELKSSIIQKEDRGDFNPVISDLYCKAPQADLSDYQHWIIETHDTGNIEFVSKGYTQVVRKLPLHTRDQRLTFEHREGFSFGLEPCKLFK